MGFVTYKSLEGTEIVRLNFNIGTKVLTTEIYKLSSSTVYPFSMALSNWFPYQEFYFAGNDGTSLVISGW